MTCPDFIAVCNADGPVAYEVITGAGGRNNTLPLHFELTMLLFSVTALLLVRVTGDAKSSSAAGCLPVGDVTLAAISTATVCVSRRNESFSNTSLSVQRSSPELFAILGVAGLFRRLLVRVVSGVLASDVAGVRGAFEFSGDDSSTRALDRGTMGDMQDNSGIGAALFICVDVIAAHDCGVVTSSPISVFNLRQIVVMH